MRLSFENWELWTSTSFEIVYNEYLENIIIFTLFYSPEFTDIMASSTFFMNFSGS